MTGARDLFHPQQIARNRAARAGRSDDNGEPVIDPTDLAAIWDGRARMATARLAAGVGLDGIDLHALDRHHLHTPDRRSARSRAAQLQRLATDLRAVAAWLRQHWPDDLPGPVFAPVDPDREASRVVLWVHCADRDTMQRAAATLGVRTADLKARAGYVTACRRQGRVRLEAWCRTGIWREQEKAA